MKFTETPIAGAFVIETQPHADERGLFARTFCTREFDSHGLVSRYVQENTSYNKFKGTLRGMHFQKDPKPEIKLVRCTRGRIFDVIVDLRPDSRTYLKSFGRELTEENRVALYIPAGCAHGFQTLEDDSEVLYLMSEYYEAPLASGVRYDDPAFEIRWPLEVTQINDRDRQWPLV